MPVESVTSGSKLLHIMFVESNCKSFGGTICVMYPVSSREKGSFLNPFDTNALLPKLELEFVIDCSPPDSDKK